MKIETVEDAVEAYKSLGNWQYADREAAWKWMFEQGRIAEREACAAACDAMQVNKSPDYYPGQAFDGACRACADEIRKRSNEELRGAEQASLAERPSRTQGSAAPEPSSGD